MILNQEVTQTDVPGGIARGAEEMRVLFSESS